MRSVLLLFAVPLAAQIQVSVLRDGQAEPVGATIALGNVAVGDTLETRLRATNASSTGVAISNASVAGAGFSLSEPFRPLTLAPGGSVEIGIRFAPGGLGSYSAALVLGPYTAIVRAAAVLAADVALVSGGVAIPVPASGFAFEAFRGERRTVDMELRNAQNAALELNPLRVSGPGYSLEGPARADLAPGESVRVRVVFDAASEGTFRGTLEAGARRLPLSAIVTQARLGPARILKSSAVPAHAEQLRIRLMFEQSLPIESRGTLRAVFSGAYTDPAIQFQNGGTEIPFTVPAGATQALFGSSTEAILQTGTTAGSLRLEAVAEGGATVETIQFARAAIGVDQAAIRRDGSSIEVSILGYDNTRTAGSANFRFYDRAGNAIGGVITANFTEAFHTYFNGNAAGGAFRLRAVFPVTGDATMVGSVLIELANSVGRTDLQRLTLP